MKLATTMGDLRGYWKDRAESMEMIRAAGFRHLDFNFEYDFLQDNGFFSNDYDGFLKRIRSKAEELEMDFVQSHAPAGKPLLGDDAARKLIEGTKICIRACHDLGIPHVVVHSGYLQGISREECFERNKVFYGELLREAEKYGVCVLVENYDRMYRDDYFWVDNARDLRALIDYIDHPLCHAVWDAGHANLQEMPQHEELALLGDHVMALHVQDNKGDRDTHLMPFFGSLNMDSLMQGLKDINYKGAFTFEVASMLTLPSKRRPHEADTRLLKAPLSVRMAEEKLLYEVGKATLEAYDLFEE